MSLLQCGISGKCVCLHSVPEIVEQWVRLYGSGKVFAVLCFFTLSDDMEHRSLILGDSLNFIYYVLYFPRMLLNCVLESLVSVLLEALPSTIHFSKKSHNLHINILRGKAFDI